MTSLTQNYEALRATLDYAQPRKGEEPDVYPPGRRCLHETAGARCITILHRYHEGPWCHVHEGKHMVERLQRDGITFHCGMCGHEPPADCSTAGCPFHA